MAMIAISTPPRQPRTHALSSGPGSRYLGSPSDAPCDSGRGLSQALLHSKRPLWREIDHDRQRRGSRHAVEQSGRVRPFHHAVDGGLIEKRN